MAKKITNINQVKQDLGNAPVGDSSPKIANTDKDNIKDTSSGIPTVTAKDLENDKWENINMPVYINPVYKIASAIFNWRTDKYCVCKMHQLTFKHIFVCSRDRYIF